MGNIIPTSGA